MDYQEAIRYITELQENTGSDYSLEPVRKLCERAGRPDRDISVVHIAGTNGKGSIGTYLSNILAESGYTVGRYVSPTLLDYRERIQRIHRDTESMSNEDQERRFQTSSHGIVAEYISEQEVAEALTKLRYMAEQMAEQEKQLPTAFEIETVMAFLVMAQWHVDVAVIECGMGGRTDATNIIAAPKLCLFAHIGLDHTAFLGETVREIAEEKYGILKWGTTVVSVKQDREAEQLLQRKCTELALPMVIADSNEVENIHYDMSGTTFQYRGSVFEIGQAGTCQIENAIAAIEAAGVLQKCGFEAIHDAAIRIALRLSKWRGRFECVSEKPYVLVDGAHNPQAAKELRHSLEEYFQSERFTYVCGIFRDKDYSGMMDVMLPLAERVYTVTPVGKRGLPARELAKCIKDRPVQVCESVADALDRAIQGKERTIVFGSLSFLHEVYEYFEKHKERMTV